MKWSRPLVPLALASLCLLTGLVVQAEIPPLPAPERQPDLDGATVQAWNRNAPTNANFGLNFNQALFARTVDEQLAANEKALAAAGDAEARVRLQLERIRILEKADPVDEARVDAAARELWAALDGLPTTATTLGARVELAGRMKDLPAGVAALNAWYALAPEDPEVVRGAVGLCGDFGRAGIEPGVVAFLLDRWIDAGEQLFAHKLSLAKGRERATWLLHTYRFRREAQMARYQQRIRSAGSFASYNDSMAIRFAGEIELLDEAVRLDPDNLDLMREWLVGSAIRQVEGALSPEGRQRIQAMRHEADTPILQVLMQMLGLTPDEVRTQLDVLLARGYPPEDQDLPGYAELRMWRAMVDGDLGTARQIVLDELAKGHDRDANFDRWLFILLYGYSPTGKGDFTELLMREKPMMMTLLEQAASYGLTPSFAAKRIRSYERLGELERSDALLAEMIAAYPDAAWPRVQLAFRQIDQGQFAEALATIEAGFVRLQPEEEELRATLWLHLGLARDGLGDRAAAVRAFQLAAWMDEEIRGEVAPLLPAPRAFPHLEATPEALLADGFDASQTEAVLFHTATVLQQRLGRPAHPLADSAPNLLDALALELKAHLAAQPGANAPAQLASIGQFLRQRAGIKAKPGTLMLDSLPDLTLLERSGNCVGLSSLTLVLARRCDVPVTFVRMPGHACLRVPGEAFCAFEPATLAVVNDPAFYAERFRTPEARQAFAQDGQGADRQALISMLGNFAATLEWYNQPEAARPLLQQLAKADTASPNWQLSLICNQLFAYEVKTVEGGQWPVVRPGGEALSAGDETRQQVLAGPDACREAQKQLERLPKPLRERPEALELRALIAQGLDEPKVVRQVGTTLATFDDARSRDFALWLAQGLEKRRGADFAAPLWEALATHHPNDPEVLYAARRNALAAGERKRAERYRTALQAWLPAGW